MFIDSKPIAQLYLILLLLFLFLRSSLSILCGGDENSHGHSGIVQGNLGPEAGCNPCNEVVDAVHGVHRSAVGCQELVQACAQSGSLCFLSLLPVSRYEEDDCEEIPLKAFGSSSVVLDTDLDISPNHVGVYELLDGQKVSCSYIGGKDGKDGGISSRNRNGDESDSDQCKGPIPPYSWMQGSSAKSTISPVMIKNHVADFSLPQHVDIQPTSLDWGEKQLYSPSFAYLKVTNIHNESTLYVYECYSSDAQFYSHDFGKLAIAPGETTMIKFVFLPRRLGSLSAHVVLQTNFGGFIVNAAGVAVESLFRIPSSIGFEFSKNGRLTKGLKIYNPFDDVIVIEEVILRLSMSFGNQSNHAQLSCQHMGTVHHSYKESDNHVTSSIKGGNGYDKMLAEMRPRGKWKIHPYEEETILDMTFLAYKEVNVTGLICVHLRRSSSDHQKIETVIFPLEIKNHHDIGYHSPSGISAFLDPFLPQGSMNFVLVMSIGNDASELLSISEITEIRESNKLFEIKYIQGLVLFPGMVTHVALITCPSLHETDDVPIDVLEGNSECVLHVATNDSMGAYVDIPCQDIEHVCSRKSPESQYVTLDDSTLGLAQYKKTTELRYASSETINNQMLSRKPNFVGLLEANEFILRSWKAQGAMNGALLLEEHELVFSRVEIGHQKSKWITVKNPSGQPVIVQLSLNPRDMIYNCEYVENVLQYPISQYSHLKSAEALDGFFLPKSAISEGFIHPYESISLGPIVFRPSDRCTWSSAALVRNNLSGVEWLPIQGTGASKVMVLLEGSRVVHKLDFNLNWSTPFNVSFLEPKFLEGNTSFSCLNLLSKDLQVKNVGELPLEVVRLQVSGIGCALDGFTVHTCKGFALSPGETARLHISYQPDFSAAVISRDLEFMLPSGVFVIPMKANVPIFAMKLCQKSLFWSFLKMSTLLIFVCLSIAALLSIMSHAAHFTDDVTGRNTITSIKKVGKPAQIHRNLKNVRAPKDNMKAEVVIFTSYSNEQIPVQGGLTNIIQTTEDSGSQERDSPLSSESKLKEDASNKDNSYSTNLTIKTEREKIKRRKRRSGLGSGLASKCSSQSGNSTPSSPLSPNTLTPKHAYLLSPDSSEYSFAKESVEKKQETYKVRGSSPECIKHPGDVKCDDYSQQASTSDQFLAPQRPNTKPILKPCATFPSPGWRSPVVGSPMFSASASPIAPPYARAPGSNLGRDKMVKRNEEPTRSKDLTYDIWGNHLSDHIMGRSKEQFPRAFAEASEGDSLSFFARGPPSLMKMPPVRSVSPGPELPFCDVSHKQHPIV